MLRQRARLVAFSLYFCDMAVVAAAFLCAYWVRDSFLSSHHGRLTPLSDYLLLLIPILSMWSLLLYYYGLYGAHRTKGLRVELHNLFKVAALGTLASTTLVFAFKLDFTSRLFIGLFGGLAFVGLSSARMAVRGIAHHVRRRGFNYRNILIVGTGRHANELIKVVEDHREWGLRIIGLIAGRTDGLLRHLGPYPVMGHADSLRDILQRYVVDEVLFAVSPKRLEDFKDAFLACEELGIPTRVAMNLFPYSIATVGVEDLGGVPLLTFATTTQNEFVLALKRGFDVAVASAGLLLLSPLWLCIAAMIKLTSPGPVLFKQTRVSLNGRRFTMYKFRSMYRDAEARKADLLRLNQMDGPVFKLENDPRVTPLGKFLRRTSLDECPQLINVLTGDMSLIGPRPPLPNEVEQYKPWQRRRLSMRPGLTCLWQVSGRNTIRDFNQWMKLDLQYIDNWSLRLDMHIFMKTLFAVVLGRGAS